MKSKIKRYIPFIIFLIPLLIAIAVFVAYQLDNRFMNGQWPCAPLASSYEELKLSDGGRIIIEATEDRDFSARGTNNKISYVPPRSSVPEEVATWHGQRVDVIASVYEGHTIVIPPRGYAGINSLNIRSSQNKWKETYFNFGQNEKEQQIDAAKKNSMDVKDYNKIVAFVANQISSSKESLPGEVVSFDAQSGVVKIVVGSRPKTVVSLLLLKDGQTLKLVSIEQ